MGKDTITGERHYNGGRGWWNDTITGEEMGSQYLSEFTNVKKEKKKEKKHIIAHLSFFRPGTHKCTGRHCEMNLNVFVFF